MIMFEIGQILTKENYTAATVWCNRNHAQIVRVGGKYVIAACRPVPEPTTAEKVQALELTTGLTRAVRELVLADGSGVSDYVRTKAQEIENLANPLRSGADVSPDTEDSAPAAAAEEAQ